MRRAYSGETLCKKCFVHSIELKTFRTISKYGMIMHRDRVAVGVSGGKDSLSLLFILKKYFDKRKDNHNRLVAITIDEGIKGYRDESLAIVSKLCNELGVENKTFSYSSLFGVDMDQAMTIRPSEKLSSCSICGTFRRRALDVAAESVGANVLATAHNMDDHLQTFMINLFAGDVERISWTQPDTASYGNGLKKIKPFVEIPEYEIAFYALQRDIPFQTEECPYMHESVRTPIRDFFNSLEREHPGIKFNAYNSSRKISTRLGKSLVKKERCMQCGRNSSGPVCSACMMTELLISNKQI